MTEDPLRGPWQVLGQGDPARVVATNVTQAEAQVIARAPETYDALFELHDSDTFDPDYTADVIHDELVHAGIISGDAVYGPTPEDVAAIQAHLKTLTDG